MCRQDSQAHSSSENAVAAEESLSIYCKPVELYNILERRAVQNPSFLQRCLRYKIQEKRKRRIKMTISLSSSMIRGAQVQRMLPLYVLLVTPCPEVGAGRRSAAYCCRTEECMLFSSSDFERKDCIKANFVLPEMKTLYDEFKSGKLSVLLISRGVKRNSFLGGNLVSGQMDASSSPVKVGGYCLWGKIPMESLFSSWDKYVSLSTGHGAELFSTVDMRPSFLESKSLEKEQCITIKTPDNPVAMQLRVNIFAQEVGAKERSPYCPLTQNSVHNSSSPHIMRMRNGNVVFNYKYYNNTLQKTEVTEDFSCPFCLAKCASFKGLRYHLCASHDLFNFDFWVTEEYQAVNVSVRDEVSRSEIVTNGVDPKLETFFLCLKPLSRTLSRIPSRANYVHTCIQKSGSPDTVRNALLQGILGKQAGASSFVMPTTSPIDAEPSNQLSLHIHENDAHSSKLRDKTPKAFLNENDTWNSSHTVESNGAVDASVVECLECVASSPNVMGISAATAQSSVDPECLPLSSGSNLGPSAILQFAKARKLSAERSDPRNHILLQKRQFFHSHRAQPMELEQVMSDRDSEDEVDDDIVDFEDRRMLDDFVDVTKDEKKIMNLWNSFVRKQRVLADGHVPWACEAFSRLHGRDLVQAPALLWCWRLFMIKLWNYGLLDSTTMNECSHILFRHKIENSQPKLS